MKIIKTFYKLRSNSRFEYFYSIFLIMVTVISVLGITLNMYFSSVLKKEAIKGNYNALVQLKNTQENVLSETDKSISSIVLDSNMINFMDYYCVQNVMMIINAQDRLEKLITLYDSFDSIDIYYIDDKVVLSSDQGTVSLNDFYDIDFLKTLQPQKLVPEKSNNGSVSFRSKINFDHRSINIPVLTFIKTIPIVLNDVPKAYVVFNIKGDYLQQSINAIKLYSQSDIMITDGSGEIITRSSSNKNSQEIQKIVEYVYKNSTKSSDQFVVNIENKKTLVSYLNYDKYNWKFIYAVPMSSVNSSLKVISIITLLFCVLMIVLSIFGALALSKKFYSPIKESLDLFKNMNTEKDVSNFKETAQLQNNINRIIQKNQSLEDLLKDYDIIRKNELLSSLLIEASTDSKLDGRLQYYNINFEKDQYFMIYVISMDNYSEICEVYTEKELNMWFIYLRENLTKIIPDKVIEFIVETKKGEIVVIVNFKASITYLDSKNLGYEISSKIHQIICKDIKYTFTLGVSLPHKSLNTISECYREAVQAINNKILLGNNKIILYENIKDRSESIIVYPFSVETEILNSLKTGNVNGIRNSLNNFADFIYKNPKEDIEYIRHYFLQLLSSSVKCFYDIDRNFSNRLVPQKEMYSAMLKTETMNEMVQFMQKLYDEVLEYTQGLKDSRNTELINTITEYIENNITAELSMELLAEKFFISISRIRKLFRDELGIAPKDYINNVRMKKAKELLCSSQIKISEIAEKVGYLSIQAFTRAFKTETGKTPGEYRGESVTKHESNQ